MVWIEVNFYNKIYNFHRNSLKKNSHKLSKISHQFIYLFNFSAFYNFFKCLGTRLKLYSHKIKKI